MRTCIAILLTTITLASPLAQADRDPPGRGFAAFLQAVAAAAGQGRAAHEAQRQADYYNESDGHYEEGGYDEQDDYYEAEYVVYEPQGPVIYDLSGDWVFGRNVNRFQKTFEGYYVVPAGRGRGVHYVEIGDNLYQDVNSSGTYEVIDEHYMVWRSNDRRNVVIELFRR